mgnify:CR=1 FL=1
MTKANAIDYISVISLIVFHAIGLFYPQLNQVFLYGISPFLFVIFFFRKWSLYTSSSYYYLCIFYLWMFICTIAAYDMGTALADIKRVLGIVIVGFIIINLSQKKELIPWLYLVFIGKFIALLYYMQTNVLSVIDYRTERASDEYVNANTYAYFAFYTTIAIYVLGIIIEGKWRKIIRILFLTMIPLSFFIAIITASRQVIIIQVPTIFFLIVSRYRIYKLSRLLLSIVIAIGVSLFFYEQTSEIYSNSYLYQRAQENVKDDTRTVLIKEAIRVGIEHPFFGAGPSCFPYLNRHTEAGHMSHCSYTDVFAECGVLGLVIFLFVIITFIKDQWKIYMQTKDELIFCFLIFGIMFGFYNFLFVFYRNLWLMAMFIVVAQHSLIYYQEKYLETQD